MSQISPVRSAADACRYVSLPPEAQELLREGMPGPAYVKALVQHGDHTTAIRVTPYVMEKPAAVWWASLCLWQVSRPTPRARVDDVLGAVLRWLRDPNDNQRQTFEKLSQAAGGSAAPAGLLALAVVYSGGSMTPANLPPVPPPDHLTPRLAGGAVLLAAVQANTPDDLMRCFVRWGLDVIDGKNRWN